MRLSQLLVFISAAALSASAFAHDMTGIARERMASGGYAEVIWTGAEHMLSGYDHLLFLLGVMFFLTRFLDILKFVTAFTLGHTITLIAATYAGITANHYLIDAVIALTVIYKGFENLNGFRRWFHVKAPDLLYMVFVFGLIHGFGLSTRLQSVTLADDPALLSKILLFNLGVEAGQILALVIMAVAIRVWQKVPIWISLSRGVNIALMLAGTGLLVFQLQGFIQDQQLRDVALRYEVFVDTDTMLGQVLQNDGQPLADSELIITLQDGDLRERVRTDAEGWFVYVGESGRTYHIKATGFRDETAGTTITLGEAVVDHNAELHIPFYVFIAAFMLLSVIPARYLSWRHPLPSADRPSAS